MVDERERLLELSLKSARGPTRRTGWRSSAPPIAPPGVSVALPWNRLEARIRRSSSIRSASSRTAEPGTTSRGSGVAIRRDSRRRPTPRPARTTAAAGQAVATRIAHVSDILQALIWFSPGGSYSRTCSRSFLPCRGPTARAGHRAPAPPPLTLAQAVARARTQSPLRASAAAIAAGARKRGTTRRRSCRTRSSTCARRTSGRRDRVRPGHGRVRGRQPAD